jgi:hypothetical protein
VTNLLGHCKTVQITFSENCLRRVAVETALQVPRVSGKSNYTIHSAVNIEDIKKSGKKTAPSVVLGPEITARIYDYDDPDPDPQNQGLRTRLLRLPNLQSYSDIVIPNILIELKKSTRDPDAQKQGMRTRVLSLPNLQSYLEKDSNEIYEEDLEWAREIESRLCAERKAQAEIVESPLALNPKYDDDESVCENNFDSGEYTYESDEDNEHESDLKTDMEDLAQKRETEDSNEEGDIESRVRAERMAQAEIVETPRAFNPECDNDESVCENVFDYGDYTYESDEDNEHESDEKTDMEDLAQKRETEDSNEEGDIESKVLTEPMDPSVMRMKSLIARMHLIVSRLRAERMIQAELVEVPRALNPSVMRMKSLIAGMRLILASKHYTYESDEDNEHESDLKTDMEDQAQGRETEDSNEEGDIESRIRAKRMARDDVVETPRAPSPECDDDGSAGENEFIDGEFKYEE